MNDNIPLIFLCTSDTDAALLVSAGNCYPPPRWPEVPPNAQNIYALSPTAAQYIYERGEKVRLIHETIGNESAPVHLVRLMKWQGTDAVLAALRTNSVPWEPPDQKETVPDKPVQEHKKINFTTETLEKQPSDKKNIRLTASNSQTDAVSDPDDSPDTNTVFHDTTQRKKTQDKTKKIFAGGEEKTGQPPDDSPSQPEELSHTVMDSPVSAEAVRHHAQGTMSRRTQYYRHDFLLSDDIFRYAREYSTRDICSRLNMEIARNGKIRCLWHSPDNHPSLHVYPDGFQCFACGKHADVIEFVQTYFHFEKPLDAAKWITGTDTLPHSAAASPSTRPADVLPSIKPVNVSPSDTQTPGKFETVSMAEAEAAVQTVHPDRPYEKLYLYRGAFVKIRFGKEKSPPFGWIHRDENGTWHTGGKGAPLYECGKPEGNLCFIVEGEKDCENLYTLYNVYTVSKPNGAASRWDSTFTRRLTGQMNNAHIVIFRDNDKPGAKSAENAAKALTAAGFSVKVPDLRKIWSDMPEKADISDYIEYQRQQGMTDDEIRAALNRLIDGTPETMPEPEMPSTKPVKTERKRTAKPLLTQTAMERVLSDLGIRIRYDRISHEITFQGVRRHWNKLEEQDYKTAIPVKLRDIVFDSYKKSNVNDIRDLLSVISLENGYNPVLELIHAEPWDGVLRFPELCEIMGITDELSKTLLHKSSLQAIALLHNTRERDYSADGMLVLQGVQGIGKTLFCSVLAMKPRWFRDGAKLNNYDKDTIIQTTSYFISEIGEIERVFKPSQLEFLKSFLTSSNDEFRPPYAHDAIRNPRLTSFIGTCNSKEFLIDDENRRFWVVPVSSIHLDALKKFDAPAYWREIYAEWEKEYHAGNGGTCYRLTAEEKAALHTRNTGFASQLNGQSEVESIIFPAQMDKGNFMWRWSTVSDWMSAWEILERRHLSSRTVSLVLNRLGIEKNEKAVRGVWGRPIASGKGRFLPFPSNSHEQSADSSDI